MKYFLSLLFFLLLLNAKGQDCKTVNEFTSYHGIKIGSQFTDSLRKYCSLIDYTEIRGDSTYYLFGGDSLRKYGRSSWLFFGGFFSDLSFSSLKDGRIYCFSLQRTLSLQDSIAIKNKEFPLFWSGVAEELTSLFGKPTKEYKKVTTIGEEWINEWSCSRMKIEFTLSYAGLFNYFALSFSDIILDKTRMIERVK